MKRIKLQDEPLEMGQLRALAVEAELYVTHRQPPVHYVRLAPRRWCRGARCMREAARNALAHLETSRETPHPYYTIADFEECIDLPGEHEEYLDEDESPISDMLRGVAVCTEYERALSARDRNERGDE